MSSGHLVEEIKVRVMCAGNAVLDGDEDEQVDWVAFITASSITKLLHLNDISCNNTTAFKHVSK